MKTTPYQLLAATLLIGSSLSGIKVALAQTVADTEISNTATATYSDGTTTYNATSNTVTVRVAEVPGIIISADTPSNLTPNAGDTLYVDFTITNVGNDPTQFFIPGTATLSDSTNFSLNGSLQIVAVNGSDITPVAVPAGGGATGTLLSAISGGGSIPPNGGSGATGTVTVRVPIQVNGTAPASATTTVSLGNTATPNAQNVDHTGNVNNTLDVYTVDNPDSVSGETEGALTQVNEAMATSISITVNARLQAFATLLKAASSYSNNNTPSDLTDDALTYSLALRVENPTSPPTGLVASDLHPTAINLDGGTANQNRILVSDAIPTATALSTATPTTPDNTWQVVYTTSALSIPAHQANWVTIRPSSGTITRVGFIRSTAIAKGTTVTSFSFSVNPISGFTGGRITNIAQVFGQSQPGTIAPGTSTQLVYDESGDQSPNNQLEGGNPDPNTGGATATGRGIGDGVANPANDGIDPGTGTTPTDTATTNQGDLNDTDGGEVTLYTIAVAPLNGPNGRPDAINTTNNDDFTNRSIVLPAGLPPGLPLNDSQTPATTFTNTVRNTSGSPATISLIPIPPTAPDSLATGTIVTITVGSDVAAYEYNGTSFAYQSGTNTSATNPVKLTTVAAGGTANYTVTIDLPGEISQTTGYSVPILAFIDENNNGSSSNEPGNITINRLYTGYVELEKDARILAGATELVGYTTDEAALSAAARPGRIIEYRIRYRNISTLAPNNSGSVDLPANNLVITEDGATAPNNWFTSTRDTVGGTLPGSATATSGAISGTANSGDIQIYVNTLTILAPQGSGEFIFRREIR
ncbi:hypothetical protein H6F51_19730 [Cyanobacteria bacterium FACHB-DQ100]|nr:hypothetical protein [Cyanobacteria bacterium FACHB-DQ100]